MLKNLFKSLFVVNRTPVELFSSFHTFIPEKVRDLYTPYYKEGSGFRVLLIFFGCILLASLVSQKKYLRYFFKAVIVFTLLLWATPFQMKIKNTAIPVNILNLPIPVIELSIFFPIFFLASFLAYLQIHIFFSKQVSKSVLWLMHLIFLALCLILFLPFWTGEL